MFNNNNNNQLGALDLFFAGAEMAAGNQLADGVYTGTIQTFENGKDSNGTHCIKLMIKVPNMANNIIMNVYDLEDIKVEFKLAYNYNIKVTRDLMFKQVTVYVSDNRRSFSPVLPLGTHTTQFIGITQFNDRVAFSVAMNGTNYHYIKRIDRTTAERVTNTQLSIQIAIQQIIQQLGFQSATLKQILDCKGKDITVWVSKVAEYKTAFWNFAEPKTTPTEPSPEDEAAVTEIAY